ncbi:hypothetical protein [Achromobacter phage hasilly_LB3]|nr:hypothetical protein [Achromobacter phage hasilly_LB3]WNO48765.1 hypothetical protein [Achromobacter phage nyaak_TL1]
MSLEQQLTETAQSTLLLTKSVDLLTALLGDVIASVDGLSAALKAQGIAVPANVKSSAEATKTEAKVESKVEETKPAPFEKADFANRMGSIVELVNGLHGDGRAIAQAVLALTGSDKIGMTLDMDAETQAKAINNLDDAIKLLKANGDDTISISQEVLDVMVDVFKPKQEEAKKEESAATSAPAAEASSDGDDFGPEGSDDYYDDDGMPPELSFVQLAMRAHAGKFGKDSAIAILKAAGSPSGAAKDLPEVRRKCVIDKLMQGC